MAARLGPRCPAYLSQLDSLSAYSHSFLWQQLYRSINYAVLDNACHEYLFILEFFQVCAPSSRCRVWHREIR
jgi:hypothetical protein